MPLPLPLLSISIYNDRILSRVARADKKGVSLRAKDDRSWKRDSVWKVLNGKQSSSKRSQSQ